MLPYEAFQNPGKNDKVKILRGNVHGVNLYSENSLIRSSRDHTHTFLTVKSSGRIIDNIISCITARRDQINLAVVRRNRIIEDRIKEFSLYA